MQIDEAGNHAVARFIAGTSWDQVPAEAQHTARLALLDTLGALLVGTQTPIYHVSIDLVDALWSGDVATLALCGRKALTLGAAFANGNAANAVDIDDVGLYTRGHPGAQLFPTALALAEAGGSATRSPTGPRASGTPPTTCTRRAGRGGRSPARRSPATCLA
jgi:2-methylcitrate dehydratase PrpD